MKLWYKMLSHPSHLILNCITVQVVLPSWHDTNSNPLVVMFGTRAVWDLPWPCGKILPKSQVCIIYWRPLGMLLLLTPLYHIPQTPSLTCIDGHLSMFLPLLYPSSHGPAKWTCWCCNWPPCSSNSNPQVTTAKSTSNHLTNKHLWMDYIWPIWWVQTISWIHGELVLSSGNTRWTSSQRCLSGVYTKYPQYQWPLEMEPVEPCQCNHRWYCSYQEKHKSFLNHLASQMDHSVSQWCRIYQLEDVQIKAGEAPGELVDHLRALAIRCNFPTDKQKEWISTSV